MIIINKIFLIIGFIFIFVFNIPYKSQSLTKDHINFLYDYINKYSKKNVDPFIYVDTKTQSLFLLKNKKILKTYVISSSKTGSKYGAVSGSLQTPLGLHKIYMKIGDDAKVGQIFVSKQNTKRSAKIYKKGDKCPPNIHDDVLTRVLVLDGIEKGINKGRNKKGLNVDSFLRGIFIHGTNNESTLGQPASHGCIRMFNNEVVELYNLVKVGTFVLIQ